MRLIDSHGHVQADRFGGDAELVIGAARLAGVERLLVPGWDPASSAAAVEMVGRYPWLDAAVGVHPHDSASVDDAAWAGIVELAADPRVRAIGETGLDTDRGFAPFDAQLTNLRRNLALALATGKPAILHCRSKPGERDAQDALVAELRRAGFDRNAAGLSAGLAWPALAGFAGLAGSSSAEPALAAFGGRPPAIIHSYSGPLDYGRTVIEMGLAISFSGLVFRPGEEASADVARLVPPERLLVETDAPFLPPPGAPRKRNEPEWVRITAAWLAKQRNESPDALGDGLVAAYDFILGRA
ncbi:MAG: TatD family hydrolase [Candidatus Limnocylindrales bacterium]